MATAIIAPVQNIRWGPNRWCLLDHYKNPTRVGVDAAHPNGKNPCLIFRHPGGGTVGSNEWYRDSLANQDYFYFLQWLVGAQPVSMPALCWDVIHATTGQQQHDGVIPRTRSLFFPESILDYQSMVSSVMHMSIDLGIDEDRCVLGGESMGALLASLSLLAPSLRGSGQQHVWLKGRHNYGTHRNRARGVLHHQGPVDFQIYGGVEYYHHSRIGGLAGTRYDNNTEWTALDPRVKAMFSIIEYIRRGETAGFPSIYISWAEQGNHINPFGDPGIPGSNLHDSRQADDLATALAERGMPHEKDVHQPGWLVNTAWPAEPNHLALSMYQRRANWLEACVA